VPDKVTQISVIQLRVFADLVIGGLVKPNDDLFLSGALFHACSFQDKCSPFYFFHAKYRLILFRHYDIIAHDRGHLLQAVNRERLGLV